MAPSYVKFYCSVYHTNKKPTIFVKKIVGFCPNAVNRLFSKTVSPPNHNLAKWLWFEKEEQQKECAPTFKKSRSKRYDVCSDVAQQERFELSSRFSGYTISNRARYDHFDTAAYSFFLPLQYRGSRNYYNRYLKIVKTKKCVFPFFLTI